MKELFEFSFSLINLIPTLLLVFVFLYWLTVLFGFLDMSSLDFDVDTDVDIDADIDVDADVHLDADVDSHAHGVEGVASGANFFVKTLVFFNVGRVPFMILLSFIVLPLWLITLYTNYYLGITNFLIAILFFIPILLVSMFFAKIISSPLAKIFKNMDEEMGKPEDFTGMVGTVRITVDDDSDGQIEIIRKGSTVVLTARAIKGQISPGKKVLVIDFLEDKKYYLVEPFS